ncbi:DUF3829 domain-containing protein [Paenibacillus woosongensis]|uniref:DUF3829 domain-containing protein n=1 Tax=Paenibacillus woosongensis TaxID=307580 RepID=A0AA95IAI0_9BACL|nr:DUF3829 domain-containing protein [Paenibacillus woosongensis]WHX48905.1 DUF3829 domain-containing protein [Paenibacillus woosongensis]
MRSRIYLIFCSVLFCVLLTSCNLIDELKGSSSVNGASIEEEHAAAKYGAYINLNNMMTGGALDRAIEGYISEFGMDENMYISEDFSGSELASFPGLDGLAKTVNTAVDRAAGEPSYGAADEALIQLGPVILDLLDTMEVITDYYNDGTYADDQFAKGKELHSQFIAQYHTYEPLANQFYNDFDQIAAQQKLSDLDKLKEQDYLIRYHALSVVMRAQDIEKAFFEAEIFDENILDCNLEEYRILFDLLVQDSKQFTEYAKDAKRRKQESWTTVPELDAALQEVIGTATDILTILETKDTSSNRDNNLVSSYFSKVSNLIDAYNYNIRMDKA